MGFQNKYYAAARVDLSVPATPVFAGQNIANVIQGGLGGVGAGRYRVTLTQAIAATETLLSVTPQTTTGAGVANTNVIAKVVQFGVVGGVCLIDIEFLNSANAFTDPVGFFILVDRVKVE